jgi:tetratricopeptide (TPR) repeat protein
MEDIQEEKVQHEPGEVKKKSFDVQDKVDQAEFFLDKNRKKVSYVIIAFVVLVGAFVAYKFWYMPGVEAEAQKESFYAFLDFEKDSLNQAVKGGTKLRTAEGEKVTKGLTAIAEEYGSTKAGKIANYQLGCIYMRQGKFELAIEKFRNFDSDDKLVSAIAIGATGDCYMELNKWDEAVKHYLKAADKNPNVFTSPIYLKKAGLAYESKQQYAEALKMYQRIQREFAKLPNGQESSEARDIKKFIARVKALGNL